MVARRDEKVLRAVQPNAGIRAAYQRKLDALIAEMANSYRYWIRAKYRSNPPAMAQDEMPARELERLMRQMGVHWRRRFEAAAPALARFFAQRVHQQSQATLRRILKDSGITVQFKMTAELRDIMVGTIAENVSLIKSIPAQYHTQVEGLVMRSVTAGRDLATLTKELEQRYGVTRKRAEFIALDQNNKATSAIQRERQMAVGLDDAIWMHSHAGKQARKTHKANDRKHFSIKEGWFDPDPKVRKIIWPGILPRCRCTWRPVVKGFS